MYIMYGKWCINEIVTACIVNAWLWGVRGNFHALVEEGSVFGSQLPKHVHVDVTDTGEAAADGSNEMWRPQVQKHRGEPGHSDPE